MYECENCKNPLPEITGNNFKQTDGGKCFHPDYGEYYWFEGEITCDCGHKQVIQDQTI